jgi:hypothetical protein
VRRSIASILVVLGALSTTLAAQSAGGSGALAAGFAATLGGGWQIESGEIGWVWRKGHGPVRAVSLGARLGAFIDEGAILGGSRGFVFGGTVGARTDRLMLAELGDQNNLTQIGVDLTLEATGYLGSHSPLPQGSTWGAVALLPGLRVGSGDGPRYALLIGPTWFLGSSPGEIRGLLAFRVEAPLARRESHP